MHKLLLSAIAISGLMLSTTSHASLSDPQKAMKAKIAAMEKARIDERTKLINELYEENTKALEVQTKLGMRLQQLRKAAEEEKAELQEKISQLNAQASDIKAMMDANFKKLRETRMPLKMPKPGPISAE